MKQIPNYSGYSISKEGDIFSDISNRMLRPYKGNHGYMTVTIGGRKGKLYLVHQLVAMTYLGFKPDNHKSIIDHKNGIKDDNRLENLQVISHRENVWKQTNLKCNYPGVRIKGGKYEVSAMIYGEKKYIGTYDTAEIAYGAYIYHLSISV